MRADATIQGPPSRRRSSSAGGRGVSEERIGGAAAGRTHRHGRAGAGGTHRPVGPCGGRARALLCAGVPGPWRKSRVNRARQPNCPIPRMGLDPVRIAGWAGLVGLGAQLFGSSSPTRGVALLRPPSLLSGSHSRTPHRRSWPLAVSGCYCTSVPETVPAGNQPSSSERRLGWHLL